MNKLCNCFWITLLITGANCFNSHYSKAEITTSKEVSAVEQTNLKLIPTPQELEFTSGTFQFSNATQIVLDVNNTDSEFSAKQLQEEIGETFGYKTPITKFKARQNIIFTIDDSDLSAEGYKLVIVPDEVKLTGADGTGLFYGIQTLRQIIRANSENGAIPCCVIKDWPTLRLRGWQHDISRGPIPTLDFLKREVRTLSHYKLNFFTLYTEHVFRLKKHPTIAPPEGITAEEIRELDAYCKKHHVQLVGNFQSFGHTTNIQWTPGYEHLFKNGPHYPWNFDPDKEATYRFLSEVYSEIAPAYQSSLFVINCDEVGGISSEKYAGHITRVAELLKKYGKTPLMWGDIALHKKDIIPMLPEDILFLTWNYYAKDNFDASILPLAQAKRKFLVCPAVWSFGSLMPRFEHSIKNISHFIRDGARHGALGTLCTQWQDVGEELSNANWYLLVWSAENAWLPLASSESQDNDNERENRLFAFNQAFDPLFYGIDGDGICQSYLRLSQMRSYSFLSNIAQHSDRYCYRGFWCISLRPGVSRPGPLDLIAGDSDQLLEQTRKFLAEIDQIVATLKELRQKAEYNADTVDSILFAASRIRFIGQRLRTRIEMGQAWQNVPEGDKVKAVSVLTDARQKINGLLDEIEQMRVEYVRLWYQENRSWWLPYNHARYDRLRHRIGKALGEVADAGNRLQQHDQWPDAEKVYLSLTLPK